MPWWQYAEFDWDDGNVFHLYDRHRTLPEEAEEAIRNSINVRRVRGDRYEAIGRTDGGQILFVIFERRHRRVRVISAREM